MPRSYPAEFRRKVLDLVEAGRPVAEIAEQLGVTGQTIYNWRNQDLVDRGLRPGITTLESVELAAARKRIRELETELAVTKRALSRSRSRRTQKALRRRRRGSGRRLPRRGRLPRRRGVGVGLLLLEHRPPSARSVRHGLLLDVIAEIHQASRRTYGARRIHAEQVHGRGLQVARCTVELIMRRNGLAGLPGRHRYRKVPNLPTATDLVDRRFHRSGPDQMLVTDITEHPTREGKIYCAVVLDAFSRRVVGWSIDSRPQASLATSALAMAIENREPHGSTIHSDHGTQFTSWAFTQRARDDGLAVSMGSIGDCFDNAVIEAFWTRMQVELLNRRRWRTRLKLSNAIFEYLEIFHNRQRRHSSLGMLTPIEYEIRHTTTA